MRTPRNLTTVVHYYNRQMSQGGLGQRILYCKTSGQALGLTVQYPLPSAPNLGFLGMAQPVGYSTERTSSIVYVLVLHHARARLNLVPQCQSIKRSEPSTAHSVEPCYTIINHYYISRLTKMSNTIPTSALARENPKQGYQNQEIFISRLQSLERHNMGMAPASCTA
jgi:hypothetical protein